MFTCVVLNQRDELLEQVVGVVRPRRRLGMILHAEHRPRAVTQPFDGAVVQVEVRDLDVGRQRAGSTAKPWFCDVISTLPVSSYFTGWFAPRWPNFSLNVLPPSARPRI